MFCSHDLAGRRRRLAVSFALAGMLAAAAPAALAQAPAAASPPTSSAASPDTNPTDRKIEVLVRSQLGVPGDWNIRVGPRTPAAMDGFDTVTLAFSPVANPARAETMEFLLSKDGKTLARLSKWNLDTLPSEHIDVTGRPVRGPETAKVEIINFDDLECPYCARMHAQLFPETLDHYKGLVKIVYKDDPLAEIHPWAVHAAVDANCLAGESGEAYWHYVDYLHTHGEDVTGPQRDAKQSFATLDKLAREEAAKLPKPKPTEVEACIAKGDETAVRASMKQAAGLNIDGTPTLFVDGERITGAQPLDVVWAAVDRALRAQGITPPPNPQAASEKKDGGAE